MMFAAMFDREDIVRLLLVRGADPSARSAGGDTAASLATSMGASRALRALTVNG
jgi:ankyrin repeat protein